MTNNLYPYTSKIQLSLVGSEAPTSGVTIEFAAGKETPAFGEVSQITGNCFFQAITGQAGILKVSLGQPERICAESFRTAASAALKWLRANHISRTIVDLSAATSFPVAAALAPIAEGLILGDYHFTTYKSNSEASPDLSVIFKADPSSEWEALLEKARIKAEAVCLARDWAHEPANVINPVTLAERIQKVAEQYHLLVKVLNDQELAAIGANALLSVGKGSATPARMIILEYPGINPQPNENPVVLVGKAITFDTGGYSIKGVEAIKGMKYDKCGGVNVIATVVAASELRLKQRVIGIIGAAENSISGSAYRPDDILKTLSGKTVEIVTTDAEGRLVLADCLAYAQKEYAPRVMIDLATLTGGIVTALGRVRAGLFSNDDALSNSLIESGEHTSERLWRMPLDEDYLAAVKGDDADLKNAGGKEGHAILAAIFLKQFIAAEVPWAHLDIAGTADTPKDLPYCPKGATGFGVRLLLDYLENLD